MKVVVAIDSFKESITSIKAGEAVKRGVLSACPDAEVKVIPIADGGEGTIDAMVLGLEGQRRNVKVHGPLGEPVEASYGVINDGKSAIIEVAQAVGMQLIRREDRNPMKTSSYGVGEIILDAAERGCRDFIIGLGGSSTVDAGIGMLTALGVKFYGEGGQAVGFTGQCLKEIRSIDVSGMPAALKECRFRLASDVKNPLYGEYGAAAVFGPQKGATKEMVPALDKAIREFSRLTEELLGKEYADKAGAGAAGGLGFALMAYLSAEYHEGTEIIFGSLGLERQIAEADYVVTGEGKLDEQTVYGKAPIGVAGIAKRYGVPVLAFAGCCSETADVCNDNGIDAFFSIQQGPISLAEAMRESRAEQSLQRVSRQVFLLIRTLEERKTAVEG